MLGKKYLNFFINSRVALIASQSQCIAHRNDEWSMYLLMTLEAVDKFFTVGFIMALRTFWEDIRNIRRTGLIVVKLDMTPLATNTMFSAIFFNEIKDPGVAFPAFPRS